MEVLSPCRRDKVQDAPIAKPSMKLWRASQSVIIQAIVPISDSLGPFKQVHELDSVFPSCKIAEKINPHENWCGLNI